MKKVSLLVILACPSVVLAFGVKHSSVETKTAVSGPNLGIEVLVKPDAGFHLTKDGPWQIALSGATGLKLETKDGRYVAKNFDEKLPGFKITAPIEGAAASGHIDYEIKAFVCTEDKTQCFPQEHKGAIDWKK